MERNKVKDKAYDSIKAMITNNEIAPGELLSENALAKMLGISRTPIREAVFMLEAEGFINTIAHKGFEVVRLDMKDIVNFMQVREGLEGIAARAAAEQSDKTVFKEILKKLEAISLHDSSMREEGFRIGRQLHYQIQLAANNKEIIRIVSNLNAQLNRIMIMSRNAVARAQISHEEHIVIAQYIIKGDPEMTEKTIRNHIIGATNDAVRVFHQNPI